MRGHPIWLQFQRAACGGFGIGKPAELAQDRRVVGMHFGLRGKLCDGAAQMGIGLAKTLVVIGQQPEHMVCRGVCLITLQHAPRQVGGVRSIALGVEAMQARDVALQPFVP